MARKLKINNGDLFARGKNLVSCVVDGPKEFNDAVEHVIVKGRNKGEMYWDSSSDFLDRFPTRVDRIVIQ